MDGEKKFKKKVEEIISYCKQIKINFKYTSKHAFVLTSSIIAAFQIIGFLCDFDSVFPDDWTFITRLFVSITVVMVIWLFAFIIWNIKVLHEESVIVINADNGHYVYVEYGDILSDSENKRNIVVTVNRCFDTIVDNDLITENTVHGKVVKGICNHGYTVDELNDFLQKDLFDNRHVKPNKTLLERDKRKGNLKRYPAGTIAEFNDNNITYFFLGMSAFNKELHPETTDMEYVTTIQSLIEYCNSRAQGFPVYMPIVGAYGRDNKKSERELLEYIVSCFRFHKHLINTDIHIVVYSGHRDEVSIYGLDE